MRAVEGFQPHARVPAVPFGAEGNALPGIGVDADGDSAACRACLMGLLMLPMGTITRLLAASGRPGCAPQGELESCCLVVACDPGEQQHQRRHREDHHPGAGGELARDEDGGSGRSQDRAYAVEGGSQHRLRGPVALRAAGLPASRSGQQSVISPPGRTPDPFLSRRQAAAASRVAISLRPSASPKQLAADPAQLV